MTKILVGTDGSDRSLDAIAFARRLAPDELLLAHAMPPTVEPPTDLEPDTRLIADASPARALHTYASTSGADLVVVGSTHTGRLGRVFPGSTGEKLLHGSPCAVAVVPRGHDDRPITRVGVAYDGTEEAAAALAYAWDLARRFDAELELIGVAGLDWYAGPALAGGAAYELDSLRVETEQRVQAALDDAARETGATTTLRDGDPADELAEHSRHLDLLVTGSRGYGPLRAVLLGAVSGRLIRTAHCPVIVVPRTARTALTQAA
jgi:nucleotide-binding universal stress UspA family protein